MARGRHHVVGGLLVLSLGSAGVTASAQTDRADEHIRRGNELRRRSRDDEALEQFRQAWEAYHSPRAQAQMALAEAALGRWLDADRDMASVLAITNDAWLSRHRAQLETVQAQIAEHVGQLEVRGGVPGAEVLLDGRPVGTLPLEAPLRLGAGSATLFVRAAGYAPLTRMVVVTAGHLVRESIDLVPVIAEPAELGVQTAAPAVVEVPAPMPVVDATIAPGHPRRGAQRTAAWVLGGGAVLTLGGAVAASLVASSANSVVEECVATPGPLTGRCQDQYDTRATADTLSIIGYVGGGALAVTALVLFVTARPSTPRGIAGLRGCGVGPGSAGAVCSFAF